MDTNFTAIIVTLSNAFGDEVYNTTTESTKTDVVIDNSDTLKLTRFVVQRILVPIIVIIGVTGNFISICVLTHRSMKSSTNCYLTFLGIFDALYLITCLTLSFKHYEEIKESWIYIYWYPRGRVLSDMWANVSVCLTVTFTVERYIAVCHPMKGRAICTPSRAKVIALVVAVASITCTVPEFWEWETLKFTNGNETKYKNVGTKLAETSSYEIGYSWFIVVMFTFVPLIALCSFNSILIHSVYRASKIRRSMTNTIVCKPGDKNSAEQSRITMMLISVALVFIICQMPTALLIIYNTYIDLAQLPLTMADINNLRIGGNVTNLMLLINAAINFVLYSVMSTKFRRVFKRMVNRMLPGRKTLFANSEYSLYTGSSYYRGSTIKQSYRSRNSNICVEKNHNGTIRTRTPSHCSNWVMGRNTENLRCSSESLYLNRALLKNSDLPSRRSFNHSRGNSDDTSL